MSVDAAPQREFAAASVDDAQRVDKWLWCARFFKTRTLAAKFVADGRVRLTRSGATSRVAKPSVTVRIGDELSFALGQRLFIILIAACATRRGPASEARALYEDLSPPPPPKAEPKSADAARAKGAGRPTKKDRRAIDRLSDPLPEG